MILRDTNIRRALRSRQRGFLLNPYRFGGPSDPEYSSVGALLHFNGSNGSTTFTDEKGHAFAASAGSPEISTAQSQFGGSSLYVPNGAGILSASGSNFDITGAFTLEFRLYVAAHTAASRSVIALTQNDGSTAVFALSLQSDNNLFLGSLNVRSISHAPPVGSWEYYAICRDGGPGASVRTFVAGTLIDTWTALTDSNATCRLSIGKYDAAQSLDTYVDEVRLTIGVNRYTASFTPPTSEFPNS